MACRSSADADLEPAIALQQVGDPVGAIPRHEEVVGAHLGAGRDEGR